VQVSVSEQKLKTEQLSVSLEASNLTNTSTTNTSNHKRPKIPVYKGEHSWHVWFNRYSYMSKGLSKEQMLDEILCHLDGDAAEMVFSELTDEIRSDYDKLIKELNSRFEEVRVPKVYEAEFEDRSQRPNESLKDYMSVLKSLHAKSWPNESGKTREIRLVSRFLKGIDDVSVSEWITINLPNCDSDECVENATRVQAAKRQFKHDAEPVRQVQFNQARPKSPNSPRRGARKCYVCGDYRHISITCPYRYKPNERSVHFQEGPHSPARPAQQAGPQGPAFHPQPEYNGATYYHYAPQYMQQPFSPFIPNTAMPPPGMTSHWGANVNQGNGQGPQ